MTEKTINNVTVAELEEVLRQRRAAEHEQKCEELKALRIKIDELETFLNGGEATPIQNGKPDVRVRKKHRFKRGELRGRILAFLAKADASLKSISEAVEGDYGAVAQVVTKLKRDHVIEQSGRGTPYRLVQPAEVKTPEVVPVPILDIPVAAVPTPDTAPLLY